jgi:hypothetical protein
MPERGMDRIMTKRFGKVKADKEFELPSLDVTGKVHGALPKVKDFRKYTKEELKALLGELEQSVQK